MLSLSVHDESKQVDKSYSAARTGKSWAMLTLAKCASRLSHQLSWLLGALTN